MAATVGQPLLPLRKKHGRSTAAEAGPPDERVLRNLLDLPSPAGGLAGRSVEPVVMGDRAKRRIGAADFADSHIASLAAGNPKNVSGRGDHSERAVLIP